MKKIWPLMAILSTLPLLVSGAEKNRFNLSEKPVKPRFQVTDKVWPKNVGEADLCLWHDDKLAALSFGVDDNQPGDIPWWKEQSTLYDFKVTWFLITGRIGYSRSVGMWEQYRELHELGHGIESHTVTHLHMEDPGWGTPEWSYAKAATAKVASKAAPKPEAPTAEETPATGTDTTATTAAFTPEFLTKALEWEYVEAKAQIEANIPGKISGVFAYSGGANAKYHDRELIAKIYRTARGARGAQNAANATDYLATNAQSGWDFGDEGKHGVGNVRNIIDPTLYRSLYYRGWAVLFTHNILESMKPKMTKTFEFCRENRDKLWIGLYADVAKYGQQRDTATLVVQSPGPDKITFLLTDEMDDSYFNFPLTVKVRVPDAWKGIDAKQADKPTSAKIIQHEGAAYALVQAIPDLGPVTLAEGSPPAAQP